MGLTPGLGRSPGVGNCNPLQYSCLESSMDRGAWWAVVHGVTKRHNRALTHMIILVQNKLRSCRKVTVKLFKMLHFDKYEVH